MKLWTSIVFCICIFNRAAQAIIFNSNCVIPPLECPNKNISFWLYTRDSEKPVKLNINEADSISSAPWVKNAPIKILIHGYTGYRDYSPNTEIRPAYLECCDYNVISIDYNKLVLEPCYLQASRNTELTGKCIAQFIDVLVQKYGFALSDFHVIGFSLGAHTAGYIGNYLKSGKLHRITGLVWWEASAVASYPNTIKDAPPSDLAFRCDAVFSNRWALDPALPLFAGVDNKNKIDSSDANFVDILHTNALQKGKLEDSGHVDFYANGGLTQPGCVDTEEQTKSSCEHDRAPQYFAESILTKKGFYATKCKSWFAYMMGWCQVTPSDTEILFGEYVPRNASGSYFFDTNSKSPYALGSRTNNKG